MAERQPIDSVERTSAEGDTLHKSARDMVGKNIELVEDLQKKALEQTFEKLVENIRQKQAEIMDSTLKDYTRGKNERFEQYASEQSSVKIWNLFRHLGKFVSGLGELDPLMQLFFLQCDQLTDTIKSLHVPTDFPVVHVANLAIPEAIKGQERSIQFIVTYRTEGVIRNFKDPEFIKVTLKALDSGAKQIVDVARSSNGMFTAVVTPNHEGKHTLTVVLCSCRLKPTIPIWVQPPVIYDRLQGPTKVRTGPGRPQFLHVCEDGKILVSVTGHLRKNECSIRKFDGSGRVIESGEETPMEIVLDIMNPGGVVQVGDTLFVADTLANTFSFCKSDGWSPKPVDPGVKLCEPHGIVSDKDGRLYLADTKNGRVRVFVPKENNVYENEKCIPAENEPPLSSPLDVAIDDSGNLYVTCAGSRSVEVFDPSTGLRYLEKSQTGLKDVFGVAVNCLGYVFVTLRKARGKIKIFNPQGRLIATYVGLWYPIGIAVDRFGSVYVAEQRGVYKYTS